MKFLSIFPANIQSKLLRYFRINDPYRLAALFAILFLLSLPLFIDRPANTMVELKSFLLGEKVAEGYLPYTEIIDASPPVAVYFYGLCDIVFGRNATTRHILAFLILFLQGAFIGIVFIDKRVFPENTYVPSFAFSMMVLISFDLFSLTADLLAFGFLLLALNALLTEIEFRIQRDETIFNMGLFVGLASLATFSYLVFLPGAVVILILFTRNNARKYMLLLTGFVLPHILLIGVHYVYGREGDLLHRFYLPNLFPTQASLMDFRSLALLGSVPLAYLFFSLLVLNRQAHLTKYQSQLAQVMFIWLLIGLIQLYFVRDLRPQAFLPMAPAFCFYVTHFLLLIRRRRLAELATWLLLLGATSTLYLSRYDKINVDYSRLLVTPPRSELSGKKILVLADDPGAYLHNTISPAFIDWALTQDVFGHPHRYDEVLLVSDLFDKDPPETIVDPENRMRPFIDRLPRLRKRYQKSENGNWVKVSN